MVEIGHEESINAEKLGMLYDLGIINIESNLIDRYLN